MNNSICLIIGNDRAVHDRINAKYLLVQYFLALETSVQFPRLSTRFEVGRGICGFTPCSAAVHVSPMFDVAPHVPWTMFVLLSPNIICEMPPSLSFMCSTGRSIFLASLRFSAAWLSLGSMSSEIKVPMSPQGPLCIALHSVATPPRRRSTRCRVDSFWIL